MKRFFLIPLMTVLCTVMAWADVTTAADLQTALNSGGTITLGADILEAGELEIPSSVPDVANIDLNGHKLSGNITNNSTSKNMQMRNGEFNGTITTKKDVQLFGGANNLSGDIVCKGGVANKSFYLNNDNNGAVTANITTDGDYALTMYVNRYEGSSIVHKKGTLRFNCASNNSISISLATGTTAYFSNANTNIQSGTITNAGTMTVGNGTIANGVGVTNSGTLSISGGTFLGSISNTGTVNITGGTIANGLLSYVNTTNYAVDDNGDGTSTISLISIRNITQDKPYGNDLTVALAEANAGDEISFLQAVNIPAGKTLDMPNVNITHNSKLLTVNGTLNISEGSFDFAAITVGAAGVLNINGGEITTSGIITVNGTFNMDGGVLNLYPATASVNGLNLAGASTSSHGNLNLSGGTINYNGSGKAINIASNAGILNITGGTLNTTNASSYAIFFTSYLYDKTTTPNYALISNLTINAEGMAIQTPSSSSSVSSNILKVNNCNITGKKTNASTYTCTGMINNAGSYRLEINGGTYTNATGAVVVNANSEGGTYLYAGTFVGQTEYNSSQKKNNSEVYGASDQKKVYISAGTRFGQNPTNYIYYNGNPSGAQTGEFDPAGCTAQLIGGKYEVVAPTSNKFVNINGTDYTSIESLLSLSSWTQTDNTVTLLQNYTWNMDDSRYIPAGYKLTIDLNGYTLTLRGNAEKAFTARGELVIDGTDEGSKVISYGPLLRAMRRGKVTINGGSYESTSYNPIVYSKATEDSEVAGSNPSTVIINGATMFSEYSSVAWSSNGAKLDINNCTINSKSSTAHGWRRYAVVAEGITNVTNSNITGVQGGLAITGEGATAEIYSGTFQTVACEYGGASHYGLYVAMGAIANVHGGSYKAYNPNHPAVLSGNEDIGQVMGIVNLYGGQYATKAKVQMAANSTFPLSIPTTSTWYSSFGEFAPLPAGYEYYETGDETYPWGVRAIPGTETSEVEVPVDPTATIPWQQQTTWKADWEEGDAEVVPEENTIVTIPVGATVVVSNDPAITGTGENKDTVAVAEQIFVNKDATLKVETGTTLNVGNGGVNIANGGQIIVEPGAIVTIGTAGMITTEDEALVIEATEEDQGVFLLQPEVTENTQPKATIKLVTKCKQVAPNEYLWERFAIPTIDGEETTFSIEGGTTGIVTYDGGAFQQGLYGWSDAQQDWVGLDRFKDMKPFKGYQLSNNSLNAGVTYVFEGNIVGNADKNYEFAQSGFGFFGNSYTGDIDIKKFLQSFGENMQKTIWIYDYYADAFKAITETNYGTIYYGTRKARHEFITDIRSMQAFLMNTFAEGQSNTTVDYSTAIWGNPKYNLVPVTPAPERVAANEDRFTVYVAGQKQEDEVSFIRNNAYSAAFDNGADASKWMNNGLNLYVTTENGDMAAVASDEIVNMTIAFRSGNETEYTLGFDNLNGEQYSLRDVLTGQVIKMTEGATYTFSQEANTTVPARFQIVAADKVTTNIEDLENAASVQQKVLKNGTLYILRDNKWYTVQGQNVR